MSPARRRSLQPRCPTAVLGLLLVAALLPAAAASLETQTSATAVTVGVDVRVADFPATTSVDRVDLWLPTSTTPGRDTTQGVFFLEWDDNGSWERVELTRVGGGTLVRGDLDGDGGYDGTGAVSNGSAQLVLEFDAVRTEEIRIFSYGGLLGAGGVGAGGGVDASTALVEIEVYHEVGTAPPVGGGSGTTTQEECWTTTYGYDPQKDKGDMFLFLLPRASSGAEGEQTPVRSVPWRSSRSNRLEYHEEMTPARRRSLQRKIQRKIKGTCSFSFSRGHLLGRQRKIKRTCSFSFSRGHLLGRSVNSSPQRVLAIVSSTMRR